MSEKRQLQDEGQEMIKLRAQLEFQVKDLEGNIEDERSTKVSCDQSSTLQQLQPMCCVCVGSLAQ